MLTLSDLAAKILMVLAVIGIITGGYFYIKHKGATEQHETDMAELKSRNEAEKMQSDLLLEKARSEVAATKAKYDQIYIGVLKSASQNIKVSESQRDAAISELLKLRQGVAAKVSSSYAKGREANISQGGIGGTGSSCQEISTAEIEARVETSRLADLSLVCTGFVREVADVR